MDGQSEKMRRLIDAGAEVAYLLMRMGKSGVSAEELQNAVTAFAAAFVEWATPVVREFLDAYMDALKKSVRRGWPRPQNQKIRLLLIDRRCKTYHCRNAI